VAHIVGAVADYRGVIFGTPAPLPALAADRRVSEAVTSYYAFIDSLDPAAALPAVLALEEALTVEPGNPQVLANLAAMYGIDVLMRGPLDAADSLARAEELGRTAMAIDPDNAQAHSVLGVVALSRGYLDEAQLHARAILRLTPYHPTHTYTAGMLIEASGDWDEGIAIIRRAVALNPFHPSHERTLLAVDDLLHDDVAGALRQARLLDFPAYVYGPLLRAICSAELGEKDAVRSAVSDLLAVCPDFFERPAEVIGAAPTMPPHAVEHLVGRLPKVRSLLR
jgi:tetratricopeptide (TPR) repeat protein